MKTIALIGSTGSIGTQVCSVSRRHPDKFKIQSIVANSSADLFLAQVKEFMPKYAALADEEAGKAIASQIPAGVKFAYGEQAAEEAIAYGDVAFIAATGFAGLKYSLKAVELHKDIALANKETLVCGGELVMSKVKGAGIDLFAGVGREIHLERRKDIDLSVTIFCFFIQFVCVCICIFLFFAYNNTL